MLAVECGIEVNAEAVPVASLLATPAAVAVAVDCGEAEPPGRGRAAAVASLLVAPLVVGAGAVGASVRAGG